MKCNILSLDGGGSWAILEAQTLGELFGYDTPGLAILARFGFAASNSGGSIVLAGLAANMSPGELIKFFNSEPRRKSVFVKNFIAVGGLERYQTPPKLDGLRCVFGATGDALLNELDTRCKLIISTFDYDRRREQFFRSDPDSPAATAKGSPQPTLAEAVHASTNAPIKYFDAPAQFYTEAFKGRRYWDGGVGGFNNPIMAAVTEALAYGFAPGDLRVLSIGTANVFLPLPNPFPPPGSSGQNRYCVTIDASGLFHDVELITTVIIDDPPDQASFVAHLLTSGAGALSSDPARPVTTGNVVRLNPWIQPIMTPAGWAAPRIIAHAAPPSTVPAHYATDGDALEALVKLDMDAIEQEEVDLIVALGEAWIADDVPNQSIRATPDLRPLIGHGIFSAGVAQAVALGLA
jgi:hypothetical protein